MSKRCRLENWVFCIRYFLKTKSKPAKKNTGQCLLTKMKPTCKNWDKSEKKKKKRPNIRHKVVVHPALQFIAMFFQHGNKELRMMYYSVNDTGILGKRKSECSYQESNLRPPITSSDALPLSYRRLVGAKAIKLGSWNRELILQCML